MKFVGVRQAQAQLRGLVRESQKQRIVLTRHGQPIALLTGVEGRDLEEMLISQDTEFSRLIERRRKHRGAMVSHELLKAEARTDLARETKPLAKGSRAAGHRGRRSGGRTRGRTSGRA